MRRHRYLQFAISVKRQLVYALKELNDNDDVKYIYDHTCDMVVYHHLKPPQQLSRSNNNRVVGAVDVS